MLIARTCRRAYKQLKAKRFASDDRGVTVIEFGLLALPFFAIIGAILETGLVLLASQIMDTAVSDATRVVRTGEAQDSGYKMPQFRAKICDKTYGLFDCSQLRIRVQVIKSFAKAKVSPPIDEDGNWVITEGFNPGGRSQVVLVETYYKWPTFLNILGFKLGHIDGDRAVLMGAARVFMNEPF